MKEIAAGTLSGRDVVLRPEASMVLYLVSPDYALRPGPAYDFTLERERIEGEGCNVFFSSAIQTGESAYRTVGTSRAVALTATAPTLEQARLRVVRSAETVPVLEWRRDVGEASYLEGLAELVGADSDADAEPLAAQRRLTVSCKDGADARRARHPPAVRIQHLPRRRRRGRAGILHRRRWTRRAARSRPPSASS